MPSLATGRSVGGLCTKQPPPLPTQNRGKANAETHPRDIDRRDQRSGFRKSAGGTRRRSGDSQESGSQQQASLGRPSEELWESQRQVHGEPEGLPGTQRRRRR